MALQKISPTLDIRGAPTRSDSKTCSQHVGIVKAYLRSRYFVFSLFGDSSCWLVAACGQDLTTRMYHE